MSNHVNEEEFLRLRNSPVGYNYLYWRKLVNKKNGNQKEEINKSIKIKSEEKENDLFWLDYLDKK